MWKNVVRYHNVLQELYNALRVCWFFFKKMQFFDWLIQYHNTLWKFGNTLRIPNAFPQYVMALMACHTQPLKTRLACNSLWFSHDIFVPFHRPSQKQHAQKHYPSSYMHPRQQIKNQCWFSVPGINIVISCRPKVLTESLNEHCFMPYVHHILLGCTCK